MAQKSAARALALTSALIGQFGPRPAGSDASRACAKALRAASESTADRSTLESFTVHPGAFLGWIRILVVVYAASVVALWSGSPLGAGDNLASSAAALEVMREVAHARSRGEGLGHLRVTCSC